MAKEGRGLKFETPLYKRDRDRLHAQVARLEAEAAPLRAALEQLKNVAKGIAHCYDELDEDERRELQQVCAESEAILLSPDAGKGWLEVREQAESLAKVFRDDDRDEQDCRICGVEGHDHCCVPPFLAALDALKGVE